jgi:hemerythrin-like domain-containing protein
VNRTRRQLLAGISIAGAGALLVGCGGPRDSASTARNDEGNNNDEDNSKDGPSADEPAGATITATEDLMREHGILRRALLVYQESVIKLRADAAAIPPAALEKTAQLFRAFGEEYHEKKLEEAYVFPAVKKAGGPAASYADVLILQHARGREITDYVLSVTAAEKMTWRTSADLVKALESFVRMYEHHAAIEDTVVFPAWKATMDPKQLDEIGSKFEEIEQEQFGEDGFEAAAKRIGEIEGSLGMADLSMFTAPPPPAAGK